MLLCLAGLALLSALGAAAVRCLLEEDDPFLSWGSGSVVGLLSLLGLTQLLRPLAGYNLAWPGAFILLAGLGLASWRKIRRKTYHWPHLGRLHQAALLLLLACTYFVMHTREMKAPEDDFFVHFPLISLMARGHYPPPNPFFENLTLFGHFGRDLLISIFSQINGHQILPATWALNLWLQLTSLALAVGLGYRSAGKTGAVLLPWFLFCGVSVGSRAGLIDTYDNNNALVYASLLALVHWLPRCRTRASWLLFGFLLGTYAIVYETHMLLFVASAALFALTTRQQWGRTALALGLSLVTASLMGGPIQDLALRLLHLRQATTGHAEAYESQRVEVHFPKRRFLQIELGQESYRRLSYVFETQALRGFAPPLDAGGYSFIFGSKVLAIHWLGSWLGFLTIIPIARRKDKHAGLLWCFGMLAFLAPGLVDFGPVHEKEYFRWEFAAGFCLSGSLALSIANAWGKPRHIFLAMLALVVLWGGEMRINQAWIWSQESGPFLRSPAYPGQREWLLSQKTLRLHPDEVDLATRLRPLLSADDRVITDIESRGQWDFFKEATLAGLLGCRVVGHQTPPRWMPDGIAPYFRTPAWSVLWQQHDPKALPGLNATWLFTTERQPWLENLPEVHLQDHLNTVSAYQILTSAPSVDFPRDLAVVSFKLGTERSPQSEVAIPLLVGLRNRSPQPLHWQGVWQLRCAETRLALAEKIDLAPNEERELRLWFVPPLQEGDYKLELSVGAQVLASLDFPYYLKASLQQVRLREVRWTGREGEFNKALVTLEAPSKALDLAGPVRLGWRIYDKQEQRYQTPFGLDGWQTLELHLAQGESKEVEARVRWPEPGDRFRIDFFLWSHSGAEVPLSAP